MTEQTDSLPEITAYPAHNRTGWAACDKEGRTWAITKDEADKLPQVASFAELEQRYGLSK